MKPKRPKPPKEDSILNQIREEIGMGLHNGFVLWRVNQLVAQVNGRTMRGGMIDGASDLIGAVTVKIPGYPPIARLTCLECKRPKLGRQSDEQKLFENIVKQLGGYYALVTSLEEARTAIENARKGVMQ